MSAEGFKRWEAPVFASSVVRSTNLVGDGVFLVSWCLDRGELPSGDTKGSAGHFPKKRVRPKECTRDCIGERKVLSASRPSTAAEELRMGVRPGGGALERLEGEVRALEFPTSG